jgi:hypothetical protein
MRGIAPPGLALAGLILLASCGYKDTQDARHAQASMVGMTATDLKTCAGLPDRTERLAEGEELYTYSLKQPANSGGITTTLPIIGGGLTLGNSGAYCNAIFRIRQGRVSDVRYSGDNDTPAGDNGVCGPIVRGCVRQPMASMTPLTPEGQPAAPPPAPAAMRMDPVGR